MPPFLNASGEVTGSAECGRARWTTSSERVFTAEFFRTGIIAGSVFVVFGYHGSKLGIRVCVEENRYVWWDDLIFIMFHICPCPAFTICLESNSDQRTKLRVIHTLYNSIPY